MMHVLPCERVRDDLPAFHDGELSIDEQVRIQSHLQECVACRLEAMELAELGAALRGLSAALAGHAPVEAGRLTAPVLERLQVERQLAFGPRLRALFEDMHLVWAGLGATAAVVICVFASAGVLQAANRERPDSLAGIISHLATAGSNTNPVRLQGYMLAPRAHVDTAAVMPVSNVDAELAVSAVVTREGRIQDVEVLSAEQARALRAHPDVVLAMLEAVSRARFEPAQAGGAPVAVSMIWLLSSTTVTGGSDYDRYLVTPPRLVEASTGPAPRRPRVVDSAPAPIKPAPSSEGYEFAG